MKFAIISAPFDYSSRLEGASDGPGAIVETLTRNLWEPGIAWKVFTVKSLPRKTEECDPRRKRVVEAMLAVDDYYAQVSHVMEKGYFPIYLGGEHTVAFASAKATSFYGNTGILWIDAHGDYNNSRTSPSGNVHGMALRMITGRSLTAYTKLERPLIREENAVLFGTRDVDPLEKRMLKKSNVTNYSMKSIRARGLDKCIQEWVERFRKLDGLHISLDLDALDPKHAPGVGTPVEGGFTLTEIKTVLAAALPLKPVCLDVVEYNPYLDREGKTAATAAELISWFVKKLTHRRSRPRSLAYPEFLS